MTIFNIILSLTVLILCIIVWELNIQVKYLLGLTRLMDSREQERLIKAKLDKYEWNRIRDEHMKKPPTPPRETKLGVIKPPEPPQPIPNRRNKKD